MTRVGVDTQFIIPTEDGKRIYGFVNSPSRPTKSAIILVHGLTGHMDEYIHLMLSRQLISDNYTVLRFNQYGDGDAARVFHETSISVHVADTKRVVSYAQSLGYSEIVLAGHSLGGPVAIAATDDLVKGLILIDPAGHPKQRLQDWQTYDQQLKASYINWSMRIILGEQWIEDAKGSPDPFEQFAKVNCPVQIIAAELAEHMEYCKKYQNTHPDKPEIELIPGADHCFTAQGAVEGLGAAINSWLVGLHRGC